MDYIDIILRGYSDENDRQFLSKYFIRECKKAEKEFYDFDVFFAGLSKGIETLKEQYKTPFYKRKNELCLMLDRAKNKTLKYGDLKTENIEESYKKTIEYCESELSTMSFENFPINILHLTDYRYKGSLYYSEVEHINNEINEAHESILKLQQPETIDFSNSTKQTNKESHTNTDYYTVPTPQNNLDAFLNNDLNIEIFEYIEGIQYDEKPNTLDYFNLLFSEFNFFIEHKNDYLKIKEHFTIPKLKTASKDDKNLYLKSLIYFKLIELIKQTFPLENRKSIIKKTCDHIEKINQSLMDFNLQSLQYSDDFRSLREDIEKLDYKSQLIEWTNIKYTILQDDEESNYTKKEALSILKKIDFEIERISKIVGIEFNEPQQPKPQKKKVLTDDRYYNVLENCTIEAFECLNSKDLYPKDGTKAIWDISNLTIQKGDGLPTQNDKELFRKEYIKDNMRTTFLIALDRHCTDFTHKYSITRTVFYKKCYQSLLSKISKSPIWEKPDFGIDINNPCVLTFIWNMRSDIEARSIEPKATKKQTESPDILNNSIVEKEVIVIKEPYGEMFANNGFKLFEHILNEYVKPKNSLGRYEDLSYYYRCLFEDKFIHQRPEPFKLWFIEKYTEEFTKVKTKNQTTNPQRKKDYSIALEWFKLHNK